MTYGPADGSWVHRHLHADFWRDSHRNCEPKDTRLRDPPGAGSLHRAGGDGHNTLYRSHLRRPPQPCCDHCLCCAKALPMEARPSLHRITIDGIIVCCICTERDIQPSNGWRRDGSFSFRGVRSGFRSGVHHFLLPHVCCHCCRHRHQSSKSLNPCIFMYQLSFHTTHQFFKFIFNHFCL